MEILMEGILRTKIIRKNRKRHGLMMTVCAFLRAKTGNMVSILQITFRKIDAADFADTPLFGKIQKEEKLNSTKKRKSDLLAEIACYLFIHVFFVEQIQL